MSDDDKKRRVRRYRIAAALGAVLAVVCHFLPHDYQAACQAVASVCTGGF